MDLPQLRAFVVTVQRGSILAASQALGLSTATLRARLDALESELGAAVLIRTHRGAEPTELGVSLLHRAQALLLDADALMSHALREKELVVGELCTMGPGASLPPMMSALVASEMRRRHPELKLRYLSSEDPRRDAGPEVDLLLQFGDEMNDGPFRTFTLARFPVQLLASRDYLDRRGRPQHVEDLAGHDILCWEKPAGDGADWPLVSGGTVRVDPCISSTDALRLRCFAAVGLGIGLLPDSPLARGTIPGEELEVVLPDEVGREGLLRVLIRESSADSARTHAIKKVLREVAEGMFGVISAEYLQDRDV